MAGIEVACVTSSHKSQRGRPMYTITLDFDKNLHELNDELVNLGSVQHPIEIKVSTGDVSYRLNSIGRAHFEAVREGDDQTPITDGEMNAMMKWALISLAKTLQARGSINVTGLKEIEKGSRYERCE